ncbi:MAG: 50S ribosomal protein L11 methyltransferase [Pseudomonadota bacterium]
MTWTALTTLGDARQAAALGEALDDLDPAPTGVGVFELEDGSGLWEVGGYFTESPDEIGLAVLAAAFGAQDFAVSELPETDWVAHVRRELHPVEAGRFFVYGSHDADRVPEGRVALLIEAAMAFGTGHHGTTQGCLEMLDHIANQGFSAARVADIGCGTAVLAMAASRIWPDAGTILASDIDQVAVEVAQANIAANDLGAQVRCLEAAGLDHPELEEAPFDLIFANILKGPLIDLAPAIAGQLAPSGRAILSGLLNSQTEDVANAYTDQDLLVLNEKQIGDWTTLLLGRF